MSKRQKEKHAGTRKVCIDCGGEGKVHLGTCDTRRGFDCNCNCGYPVCPTCGGTGVRNRHDGSSTVLRPISGAPVTLVVLDEARAPFQKIVSPQFIDEIKHVEDAYAFEKIREALEANTLKDTQDSMDREILARLGDPSMKEPPK